MAFAEHRRGFTKEEATSLHRLLDTLSLYCAESVIWWDQGQGEPLDGKPASKPADKDEPQKQKVDESRPSRSPSTAGTRSTAGGNPLARALPGLAAVGARGCNSAWCVCAQAPGHAPRPVQGHSVQRKRNNSGRGKPHRGTAAADPAVLPLGTVIRVAGAGPYSGQYLVKDTGNKVNGRHIDIYMPTVAEAKRFGRKRVSVFLVSKPR